MALESSAAYIVVAYDSGPLGLPGMQALINEKAAEGYALHQAISRTTYHWVLIFHRIPRWRRRRSGLPYGSVENSYRREAVKCRLSTG